MAFKDLTNQTFGLLKVVERIGKDKCGSTKWLCRCSCGSEKKCVVITSELLKKRGRVSCGCSRHRCKEQSPNYRGIGEFSGRDFSHIKRRARHANMDFSLTKEYLWELFLKQNKKCALSNISLKFSSTNSKYDGNASLDRIDSSKGYAEGNVQWVHKDVNNMKQQFSQQYFIELCCKISESNFITNYQI